MEVKIKFTCVEKRHESESVYVPESDFGWCRRHHLTAPDRCYRLNQASLTRNKGRAGEFPVGEDQ